MTDIVVFTAFSGFLFLNEKGIPDARSRAGPSRDDKVNGFQGRLKG